MICQFCGKEFPDGSRFCIHCGKQASSNVPQNGTGNMQQSESKPNIGAVFYPKKNVSEKAAPTSRKKLWIILASVFAGLALITAAIILLNGLDVHKFSSAVKAGETSRALQLYNDLSHDDRAEAIEWLQKYIESVENDYFSGKIDYSAANSILSDIALFDSVYDDAEAALECIIIDNRCNIAYQQAQKYAEEENWLQAYQTLDGLNIQYRYYDEAAALRSQCADNLRTQVLSQCEELEKNADYQTLIGNLTSALQILPDDTQLTLELQKYSDQFESATLANAKSLAEEKRYSEAIELLVDAGQITSFSSFDAAISEYQFEAHKAKCEELMASSGYEGVISYLEEVLYSESYDERVNELYASYTGEYINSVLAAAKEKADKREFDAAISLLREAQSVYYASEFESAISEYEGYLPIDLADCHVIDSTGDKVDIGETLVDEFGNKYSNSIGWSHWYYTWSDEQAYCIMFLDKKYISLSGTLAPQDCSSKGTGTVQFFADNALIYESPVFGITTEPFTFNVDVSGCSQLKIVFTTASLESWGAIVSATVS